MLKALSFLLRYSRSSVLLASFIGILSGGGSAVLLALLTKQLVGKGPGWEVGIWSFFGITAAVLISGLVSRFLLTRVTQRAEYDLRLHMCRQILRARMRKLEEIGTPRILAAFTQDIQQLTGTFTLLPVFFVNAAMAFGCLAYLAWQSLPVLLALLAFLAATVLINTLLHNRARSRLVLARETLDDVMRHFTTLTEGIKELKLHDARSRAFLSQDLEPKVADLRQRNVQAYDAFSIAGNWSQTVFLIFLGLLVFGLPKIVDVDPSLLMTYTLGVFFLRGPVTSVVDMMPQLNRAAVALDRFTQLGLTLTRLGEDSVDTLARTPDCRCIDLTGVQHTYYREQEDDNFTLGPVDLTLELGKLVFLVGGNGSGKTTLAKVLCGLYQPEAGNIRMDGKVVADHNLNEYRQLFSVVFSEFWVFESLLGLASPELERRTQHYLRLLHLDRKVRVQDGALSTTALSRGQRKRLALLTAYLEDRPFYIFDEWASDQDPTFKEIFYRQLLPELRARGKGILVISHDVHYHDVADCIVRLDFGRIDDSLPSRPIEVAPVLEERAL